MTKQRKTKKTRYMKAASKCHSGGVRDALTSKWTAQDQAKHNARKLGTFGAASPVVRIDPKTMEPIDG